MSDYKERLANWLRQRSADGEEIMLGQSDADLCAEALSYMVKRRAPRRRIGMLLLAVLPSVFIGVGFADLNGDGQSTFADVAMATSIIWHGVPRVGTDGAIAGSPPPVDLARSATAPPSTAGLPPNAPIKRRT